MNFLTRLFKALLTNHEEFDMAKAITPNYSDEAVARMEAVYTEASTDEQRKNAVVILANELGKTPASIIAKLVSMKVYRKAAVERVTKEKQVTKAELAQEIATRLNIENEVLVKGIAKADRNALLAIERAVYELTEAQ